MERRDVYAQKVISTVVVKCYRTSAFFCGSSSKANSLPPACLKLCWYTIAFSGIVQTFRADILLVDLGQEPAHMLANVVLLVFLDACAQLTRGP